jgi:hypothetical protein
MTFLFLDMKPDNWSEEEWELGWWLSASLDDPHVCQEFKDAVTTWFNYLEGRNDNTGSTPTTPSTESGTTSSLPG